MDNDETDAPMARYRAKLEQIDHLQRQRTELTATGTAERRRVTVTVNADGIPIDIRFSSDITDLEYSEIADAITEASQRAVADVAEQTTALYAPITPDRGPQVSANELAQQIADLGQQLR